MRSIRNVMILVRGEFERLIRYKILQVGFGVSVLWLLVMVLIGRESASEFVPLFVFMDATLMTVILIGSSLFYERQENTLKSMLITPASMIGVIVSKLISAIVIALQSTLFLGIIAWLFFDVSVNFLWLIPAVILIALAHSMIGYTFSVLTRDFPSLLAFTFIYMIVFGYPSIMMALDVLSDTLNTVLLVSPTHAGLLLIEQGFGHTHEMSHLIIGSFYLVILSALLGVFVVFPKYLEKAIKE